MICQFWFIEPFPGGHVAEVKGLEALHDIHLPAPLGWWPLASGWYALALGVMLLLVVLACIVYRRHRKGRYKRQALQLLSNYETQYQQGGQSQIAAARVSELARRVALVYYPRVDVAGLQGQAWIAFLKQSSKGLDFDALSEQLLILPYQANAGRLELTPLFACVRAWIKQRGEPCLN